MLAEPSDTQRSARRVSGACRGEDKAASLRSAGVDAFAWSPDDGEGLWCASSGSCFCLMVALAHADGAPELNAARTASPRCVLPRTC